MSLLHSILGHVVLRLTMTPVTLVSVSSGLLSLRNRLLIFGIVCLVTLLIFLHSLLLSALSKCVNFSDFLNFT